MKLELQSEAKNKILPSTMIKRNKWTGKINNHGVIKQMNII